MEFLDPEAERRHRILLLIGYCLISIAIVFAGLILLYWSYGYSLTNKGEVQQNGIVFVSSQPDGATITLNGQANPDKTNARLSLAASNYAMRVSLAGYRDWQHTVKVQGGDVQRYMYLKLFPTKLTTTPLKSFETTPVLSTQSLDRRWVLVKAADNAGGFVLFDTKRPEKPVATELVLPAEVFTAGEAHTWTAVDWASDNQHVLLDHGYTVSGVSAHEYILFDRATPSQSQNLTRVLGLSAEEELTIRDKKYDQYYDYNKQTHILRAVDITGKSLASPFNYVLAYKTYGSDKVVYVTDVTENGQQLSGKVNVVLVQGSQRLVLKQLPVSSAGYVMEIMIYDNVRFIAFGNKDGKGIYLYRNPFDQGVSGGTLPTVWRYLRLDNPASLSVSPNAQFILAQSGQSMLVYDAYRAEVKRFTLAGAIDAPQTKVRWMDGYRLVYVSNGKVRVVEYDNQNDTILQAALPAFFPYFSSNYNYAYSLAAGEGAAVQLTSTPLVIVKQ